MTTLPPLSPRGRRHHGEEQHEQQRHRNSLDRFLEQLLRETSMSSLETSIVQDNPSVLMESSSQSMRAMSFLMLNSVSLSGSSGSGRRRQHGRVRRAHSTGSSGSIGNGNRNHHRRRTRSSRSRNLTKVISRWESYPFSASNAATTTSTAATGGGNGLTMGTSSSSLDGSASSSANASLSELPPVPKRRLSDEDEGLIDDKLKNELAQLAAAEEDDGLCGSKSKTQSQSRPMSQVGYPSTAGFIQVNGRVVEANQPLNPHLPPPPPRDEMIHVPASRTFLELHTSNGSGSNGNNHRHQQFKHNSKHSSPKMPRRRYDSKEVEQDQQSSGTAAILPSRARAATQDDELKVSNSSSSSTSSNYKRGHHKHTKRKQSSRRKNQHQHQQQDEASNNDTNQQRASLSPERAPRFPQRRGSEERDFNPTARSCSDPALVITDDSNVVSVKQALTLMNASLPRRQASPYHGSKMKVILSQAKQTMLLQEDAGRLLLDDDDDDDLAHTTRNERPASSDEVVDDDNHRHGQNHHATTANNLPRYLRESLQEMDLDDDHVDVDRKHASRASSCDF